MANPDVSDHDLQLVRAALIKAMPLEDRNREDVVQEALLRLVREPTPVQPVPLMARARQRLRDARVDYLRRENVRPPLAPVAVEPVGASTEMGVSDEEALNRVLAFARRLERIAGPDAVAFVWLKWAGYTEAEIASFPGWNAQRVGAARRRLTRVKEQFPQLLGDETR